MQSIVPAPVPQNMQNQVRNRAPLGMKRAAQDFYHEAQANTTPLQEMSVDNDLRALAAVISTGQHQQPQQHQQSQQQQQQQHSHSHASHTTTFVDNQASSNTSAHDNNIDPAIGGAASGNANSLMMVPVSGSSGNGGGESGGDDISDGRKIAKRELSQSKRAAQNRAAQRAFRQRKEGYIKKLENQVRELNNLDDSLKASQAENYSLREYIIHLQSRLIESQGEFPQPPPNINLVHPHSRLQQHHAPIAPMNSIQTSTPRNIAASGLVVTKQESFDQSNKFKDVDNSTNDSSLRSQLQANNEGMPGAI
ncbi:putative transmembrane protein [Erysiphe necator]|uniref:Putative transcription factor kapC n=1 Tax=Uncinula necator TaxID=52586 RepID=A0A0B1PFZ6_UNCNE|nr:putative transmembrane protein [Erysiphe necator]